MVRSAPVMRISLRLLPLLPMLFLATPSAGQPLDTWYASRMTMGGAPVLVEYFWSMGHRMRAQSVVGGRPLLTLVNEKRYIIIDGMARTGISIERSPIAIRQDADRGRPFGNEAERMIAGGAEMVGTTVVAGQDAERYRVTDAAGRREVWVTKDELRVPIQVMRRDRRSGTEIHSQYLDWNHGVALPDAFFEPPPDVTLESYTYDAYIEASQKGAVGPAPPFYADLLHGVRNPEEGIDLESEP